MHSSPIHGEPAVRCRRSLRAIVMYRALFVKELREVAVIGLIGLALLLIFVSGLVALPLFSWFPLVQSDSSRIPFVAPAFLEYFGFCGAALAIALGIRQSLWEDLRGTAAYLLHRPMSRSMIFGLKLAAGIVTAGLATAIPFALYAWWAATPGHHPSPFDWTMTDPAFRWWLSLPLLYFGSFLSGIRPARWFGTRLLPLVAAAFITFSIQFLPRWWWAGLPALLLLDAAMLSAIFWVSRTRDF